MEHLRGATAPNSRIRISAKVKTFVLDTNVLLHDPQSIFKFEENNLAIPVEVLEELDSIKGEQSTERGRNARRVHRILQELLPDSRAMHEGVELPNGGTLSIIINPYLIDPARHSPAMVRLRAILPDLTKKDNRIIAAALFVQEQFPPPTILVTMPGRRTADAYAFLLERDVLAPAGSFYAYEAFRVLDVPDTHGLRMGLAPYSDDQDVDRLLDGIGAFLAS